MINLRLFGIFAPNHRCANEKPNVHFCSEPVGAHFFFLMIRRPPRSTRKESSAASDVYKRQAPDLVKRLFEQEVPEVYDGTVEIVSIAREAGDRTKIAVKSNDSDIDPVGTLVGPKGARVQNIVNELGGENIDVVKYEDNP